MVADPRRSRARSRSPVHVRSRRPMRPVSVRSIPARRGSGWLAGSKRNVVLYPLSHGPDLLDQVGEIAAVLDEVDVRAVDHQERGLRVTVKVVPERLRQPLQVLRGDAALEVPVALAEPAQQHLRPGLEIDDEVRPGEPLIEHLEDLLVELELVRPERDRGEDAVLGEEVVGDDALREELQLTELALPAIALEEEEELGLEGMSLRVLVKSPEEGILLDLLEEKPRPELGGEPSCEGRLSDADGALDRDVAPRGPVRRHPRPERGDSRADAPCLRGEQQPRCHRGPPGAPGGRCSARDGGGHASFTRPTRPTREPHGGRPAGASRTAMASCYRRRPMPTAVLRRSVAQLFM